MYKFMEKSNGHEVVLLVCMALLTQLKLLLSRQLTVFQRLFIVFTKLERSFSHFGLFAQLLVVVEAAVVWVAVRAAAGFTLCRW